MNLRKIILNNFALYYRVKFFGRTISFVRSANVIFPLFILTGYIALFHEKYVEFPLFLLFVAVIIGFGYMNIKNIEHDKDYLKLTDSQRYQYNLYYSYHLDNNPEKFDSIWSLLLNPILVIFFVILYILH